MSENINVGFKVQGSELASFIDKIKKKSQDLTNDAIRGAQAQADSTKQQIKLINEEIAAIEKKQKIEAGAARMEILHQRNRAMDIAQGKYRRDIDYLESKKGKEGYTEEYLERGRQVLGDRLKTETDKAKHDYRENLHLAKEQEHQAKLQTSLAKQNIDTLKDTANANVKAIQSGDLKLSDVIRNASTDEEKLVARMTQEGLANEKGNGRDSLGGSRRLVGTLLTVDSIGKFADNFAKVAQTKNGFDLIGTAGSQAGEIAGAAIGTAIGAIFTRGLGIPLAASTGAEIGSKLGGGYGELQERQAIARQDFLRAKNRYNAITGTEPDFSINTESMGVSLKDFTNMQSEFARLRGYSRGSDRLTENAIIAERGYGVDQSTSANLVELLRSSKEGNRNLAELIGGIRAKGQGTIFQNGDYTFLNEFLGKFASLQKELLKTQTNVSSGVTMDILTKFNSVGGEFAARDPRSLGLINTINNSLKNPGTDFKKSLSFYALRKLHPEMGIADILVEQQKGIGSAGYLNSVMKMVMEMSGDENSRRLNTAGLLGLEGNQKFADDILKGFEEGKFKGLNDKELKGKLDRIKADNLTAPIEQSSAKIENALLTDHAVKEMADAFKVAIEASLSGAVIEMKDGNRIKLTSNATIKSNNTLSASAIGRGFVHSSKKYEWNDVMQ